MRETRARPVSLLAFSAISYLALPLVIFLAAFVRFEFAAVGLLALAFLLAQLNRSTTFEYRLQKSDVLLVLLTLLWISLSGMVAPFGQNSDWTKHYALLNLLITDQWPPMYREEYLRYTIGWYLPPALFLKLIGIGAYDWVIAGWTAIGTFLALRMLMNSLHGPLQVLVGTLIFAFFSGLDIVGAVLRNVELEYHLEWWAGWGQISSNTTSLYWVQQHVVPAWIGVGLMLYLPSPVFLRFAGLIFTATLLWSGFTVVGLLPFLAVVVFQTGWRQIFSLENWISLAPALVVASYVASGTSSLENGSPWADPSFLRSALPLFLLLECGIWVAALLYAGSERRAIIWTAAGTIFILCCYRFGKFNDLLMRGSAPAVTFLAILAAEAIVLKPARATIPLLLAFSLGAVTPLVEIRRLVTRPHAPGYLVEFPLIAQGLGVYRNQYLAPKPMVLRSRIKAKGPRVRTAGPVAPDAPSP